MSRRYPLEGVARARGAAVDAAKRALAEAAGARDAASRASLAAQARRDAHERAAVEFLTVERAALERGSLRVVDVARADAWAVRVAMERGALTAAVEAARADEALACEAESRSRARLAQLRADARAVELHRDRWETSRRARAEAAQEEALAEAWRPRSG